MVITYGTDAIGEFHPTRFGVIDIAKPCGAAKLAALAVAAETGAVVAAVVGIIEYAAVSLAVV